MHSPRLKRFAEKLAPIGLVAAFVWLFPRACAAPGLFPSAWARPGDFPPWLIAIVLGLVGMMLVGFVRMLMEALRWPTPVLAAYAIAARTTIVLYVGWAILSGGGVATGGAPRPDPIPWAGMPWWLERVIVCLGIPCIWATLDVGVGSVPAHRFAPILFRALTRQGLALLSLAMMWSFAWGDRRAWDWIQSRWPWVVPAFVAALVASLVLLLATRVANPRRVRRRAYAEPSEPIPCPRCKVPMRLRHRHAECRACRHVEALPRELWVCECGQPLRGVQGGACPECGEPRPNDREPVPRPPSNAEDDALDDLRHRRGAFDRYGAG